jgi:hypothetical protein
MFKEALGKKGRKSSFPVIVNGNVLCNGENPSSLMVNIFDSGYVI